MRTDTLERELKLEADLDFELPDLSGLAGPPERLPTQELRTSYFDTPDFRLWRQGMTLRLRFEHGGEDDRAIWTLKRTQRPNGPTLDRTEESWPGDVHEFPSEVTDRLRGVVRRATLEKVADLVTTRRRLLFHDADGTPSVELDDDTVTVVSGGRDGLRFRQLELELRTGHAVPEVLLQRLRGAGARRDDEPKLAKAIDLPVVEAAPMRKPRLSDVVRERIGELLRDLLDNDVMLRRDASNPPIDAVHDARVATRRLRSDLKTFRNALDPIWVRNTRAELEWLGALLGRVRDIDVLAPKLRPVPGDRTSDSDGKAVLRSGLAHERRVGARELAEALGSARYLDLLDRLHAAARVPPFCADGPAHQPARDALPPLVRRAWRRLEREVDGAGSDPPDAGLHRIRIKAKEVRYASDAAAPVCGKAARRLAKAARRLQDLLGEHHDAVAAEAWLRDEASSPVVAFAAGRLSAEQHYRQEELRSQWRAAWRRLDRPGLRAWLR
jgi:CHAD domain-containing protein